MIRAGHAVMRVVVRASDELEGVWGSVWGSVWMLARGAARVPVTALVTALVAVSLVQQVDDPLTVRHLGAVAAVWWGFDIWKRAAIEAALEKEQEHHEFRQQRHGHG